MTLHIGFTGTQVGMTPDQRESFPALLHVLRQWDGPRSTAESYFHHGDCIGADQEAHDFAQVNGWWRIWLHPAKPDTKRAYCTGYYRCEQPRAPLARNQDIVDRVSSLIATPMQSQEILRSGTWATVRRARRKRIPVWIIWPNGSITCDDADKR